MTEDEMAGWHHWLNGCGSEWTPRVGDGQGGLACWDSWGRKESDTTEPLIWSDLIVINFREGNGTPLQYSCLVGSSVHGVPKSQTQLSDFTFIFHFHTLEKERATHSSVLAWRIPGTGEPGGLPSMESHRVGHDWRDLEAAA